MRGPPASRAVWHATAAKITDRRGEQMLADYARLRITRHPVWPYHPRMWELRHNLGAYDAACIALAEALGCELLTGDVKLKNATGHHATVIVFPVAKALPPPETPDFRGWRRCHTSGMANSQPPDPRVEKTWINDAGELFVSDGTGWLPYEDLPDWPGDDDPDSKALYRDA